MTNCETFKCAACGNVRDAVVLSLKESTCKACWRAEIDLKQNGPQDAGNYEGDHAPTGWHDDPHCPLCYDPYCGGWCG